METKMSSRDKMLLIVLAIIIVVFAAVMIPSYGIKDLIINMNETRDQISTQKGTNQELLDSLTAQGISPAYAENFAQAKRNLNNKILQTKYDAVKVQQTSLSAKAYAVAEQWLQPVKYLHFDTANTADTTLYTKVVITSNEAGFTNTNFVVGESEYMVQNYTCTFSCTTDDNARYDMVLEYLDTDANLDNLSLLIATYNVLMERGSVVVKSWTYDADGISMDLVLTIPQNSHVEDYATEIGECHNCGKPYYLSDYFKQYAELPEGETEVKCSNPDCHAADGEPATLTGEAIN